METPRDDQLIADLRALRPTPRPEFAAELDQRAAAGFPRRSHWRWTPFERLRAVQPRQTADPGGRRGDPRDRGDHRAGGDAERAVPDEAQHRQGRRRHAQRDRVTTALSNSRSRCRSQAAAPKAAGEKRREQLTHSSAATAAGAAAESNRCTRTTSTRAPPPRRRTHRRARPRRRTRGRRRRLRQGLRSRPRPRRHRHALLHPRGRSRRSRGPLRAADPERQARRRARRASRRSTRCARATRRPTTSPPRPSATGELLQDSKARIDSLLAQLEAAETESEREAVEAELRHERRHRSRLAPSSQHLAAPRRLLPRLWSGSRPAAPRNPPAAAPGASTTRSTTPATSSPSPPRSTVVALAILGPIALIALLAWLTHRAWVRRERRRVLS